MTYLAFDFAAVRGRERDVSMNLVGSIFQVEELPKVNSADG